MQFITIKNWKNFQAYKDRKPKWIKLLIEIIDEYDQDGNPKKFYPLADSAKLTFVLLACLRAHYNDHIPYPNDKWLKDKLGINKLDLQPLIEYGVIHIEQESVSKPYSSVPEPYGNDTLERERERELELERERETEGASSAFFDLWNTQGVKPKVMQLTDKRKAKLKVRFTEPAFTDNCCQIIDMILESKFLQGGFSGFGFDWVIDNESNYVKILEGNYANSNSRDRGTAQSSRPTAAEREAAAGQHEYDRTDIPVVTF